MAQYEVEAFTVRPDGSYTRWAQEQWEDSSNAINSAKALAEFGRVNNLNGRVLIRSGGEWFLGYSFGKISYNWVPRDA